MKSTTLLDFCVSFTSPSQTDQQLKEKYLGAWGTLASGTATLRHVVLALFNSGVSKTVLVAWAVSAGHQEKSVRRILNQLLRTLGQRQRKPGAGRKTPRQAVAILQFARARFGLESDKYLYAASRLARQQAAARRAPDAAAPLITYELSPALPMNLSVGQRVPPAERIPCAN